METVKGSLWLGVLVGLLATLSRAIGSLVARPVKATSIDPVATSWLRVAVAPLLDPADPTAQRGGRPKGLLTKSLFFQTAVAGIIALVFGKTFLFFAASGEKVGIISTLSATTPVIILPMLWLKIRKVPAPPVHGTASSF